MSGEGEAFFLSRFFSPGGGFSAQVADAPPSRAPLSESIHIRIHSDHKWPAEVVFDTTRARLAPAENAQAETTPQGQEAGQEPVAAERHDPVEAFAEMGRETVEGRLQPPCSADQNPESDGSAEGQGRPPAVSPGSIEGREGVHCPQSVSQAARKTLTRSRTKLGTSFRRCFASSPIRARISIGSRMRSMKICAVARLRLVLKGPFGPR